LKVVTLGKSVVSRDRASGAANDIKYDTTLTPVNSDELTDR